VNNCASRLIPFLGLCQIYLLPLSVSSISTWNPVKVASPWAMIDTSSKSSELTPIFSGDILTAWISSGVGIIGYNACSSSLVIISS
jgi:hypothetical protein